MAPSEGGAKRRWHREREEQRGGDSKTPKVTKFDGMFEGGVSDVLRQQRGGRGSEEVEVMQGLFQSGVDLDVLLLGLTESLWKKDRR